MRVPKWLLSHAAGSAHRQGRWTTECDVPNIIEQSNMKMSEPSPLARRWGTADNEKMRAACAIPCPPSEPLVFYVRGPRRSTPPHRRPRRHDDCHQPQVPVRRARRWLWHRRHSVSLTSEQRPQRPLQHWAMASGGPPIPGRIRTAHCGIQTSDYVHHCAIPRLWPAPGVCDHSWLGGPVTQRSATQRGNHTRSPITTTAAHNRNRHARSVRDSSSTREVSP
jgi:hypothetical protein